VLYRIARKHAGEQPQGRTCRLDVLYKKTGCEDQSRNFAAAVRKLAAPNSLPRYHMTLTTTADGKPALHFIARHILAARQQAGRLMAPLECDRREFGSFFRQMPVFARCQFSPDASFRQMPVFARCQGSPIFRPRSFASGVSAMAQPSLFERTATGLPRSFGSKARSHEQ